MHSCFMDPVQVGHQCRSAFAVRVFQGPGETYPSLVARAILRAAQARMVEADKTWERVKEVYARRLVAAAQMDAATAEHDAARAALNGAQAARNRAERARRIIDARFSWSAITERLTSLYEGR